MQSVVSSRPGRRAAAALLAGLLAATAWGCGGSRGSGTPQHLVLVTIDTLRRDRLGAYGYERETSPHFDALAARGVLFDDAIAQAVSTTASHASMLTGLDPPSHGVHVLRMQRLADAKVTLAETLGEAGFATAAFVSATPLERAVGLDQGFDVYDDAFQRSRAAGGTNERVRAWLAERPAGRLFLWVHYFDPHHPYFAPRAFRARFAQAAFPRSAMGKSAVARKGEAPGPERVDAMSSLYDAEVLYADAALGELLAMLGDAGVLSDAVIAVLSDHGESLGERGHYFGHWDVFEETARIPMLLVHPGRPAWGGRVVAGPVGTIDLMPTLLRWLSLDPGVSFDGVDLTPAIEGAASPPRALYTERVPFWSREIRSVRGPRWLLIERPGREGRVRTLHDRATGAPAEDGSAEIAAARERLAAALDSALAAEHANAPALEVDEATREDLRALGYVTEAEDEPPPE